ncbi:FKBP-type peptidyl-prolyl cis-trans isomerase [Roseateles sp.]|jgi:FKBP-type peptidyl-prolyl cis-trans isomerase|uniref:FKBP-type peptidyl-prolyl cis-trans isomerase n=1 Tax=Roseateles sp. TaxID=1971397 RepID=UPI0037C6204A
MKTAASTRRHLLALTLVSMLGLSACGGGGGDSSQTWAEISGSNAVQALRTTDTLAGTGAEALNGKRLTVHYTGWLYDVRATNQKGSQFDSSVGKTPFAFTLGAGAVIQGWDRGFAGMKAGGKRTLVIPAAQGYGAQGAGGGAIPANAALIFEVELISVQ